MWFQTTIWWVFNTRVKQRCVDLKLTITILKYYVVELELVIRSVMLFNYYSTLRVSTLYMPRPNSLPTENAALNSNHNQIYLSKVIIKGHIVRTSRVSFLR